MNLIKLIKKWWPKWLKLGYRSVFTPENIKREIMEDTNRRLSEYEKKKPRGLRNNNPGNIRHSSTKWRGEIKGSDPDFKTFERIEDGYRALIKLLKTYYNKYGLTSINGIVNRWAPPNENDTNAYIFFMATRTGYPSNQPLPFDKEHIVKIASAISRMENGIDAVEQEVLDGWETLQKYP